jgi:hypothetical protein
MTEDSDTKQNITGDENVQINSGEDTIAAIGDGSISAGRDVIIINNDLTDEEIKAVKKLTKTTTEGKNNLLEDAEEDSSTDTKTSKKPSNAFDFVTSTSEKKFIPETFTSETNFSENSFFKDRDFDIWFTLFYVMLITSTLGFILDTFTSWAMFTSEANNYIEKNKSFTDNLDLEKIFFLPIILLYTIWITIICQREQNRLKSLMKTANIPISDIDYGKKPLVFPVLKAIPVWSFFWVIFPDQNLLFLSVSIVLISWLFIQSNNIGYGRFSNYGSIVLVFLLDLGIVYFYMTFFSAVLSISISKIFLGTIIIAICLSIGSLTSLIGYSEKLDFTVVEHAALNGLNVNILQEVVTNENWKNKYPFVKEHNLVRSYAYFVRYGFHALIISPAKLAELKMKDNDFRGLLDKLNSLQNNNKLIALLGYFMFLFAPLFIFLSKRMSIKLSQKSPEFNDYLIDLFEELIDSCKIECTNDSIYGINYFQSETHYYRLNPNQTWYTGQKSLFSLVRIVDFRRQIIDAKNNQLYSDISGINEYFEIGENGLNF